MYRYNLLPILFILFLDQSFKFSAEGFIKNSGLAFGAFVDHSLFAKTVLMTSVFIFVFIFYIFGMFLLVKPIKLLRVLSSLFVGGAFSNCVDRAWFHFVRDHWTFGGDFFFNFADVTMWVSLPLIVWSIFYYRDQIWKENCVRNPFAVLSRSHFQITKHLVGIVVVVVFSIVFFNVSFLRYLNIGSTLQETYLLMLLPFVLLTLLLATSLIFIYAQRIVGPLAALRRHLNSDQVGKVFSIRQGDPLSEIHEISLIIKNLEKEL